METFFKYQGLGNDFVVLDRRAAGVDLEPQAAVELCDRHFGVGADGVLVILSAPGAAGRMAVHNADGSRAEMCGNGLRCVAKYLAERIGGTPSSIAVMTDGGLLECELAWSGGLVSSVAAAMGPALLKAANLPGGGPFVGQLIEGRRATAVGLPNPHLVVWGVPPGEVPALGARLERHALFPQRTNVGFVNSRAAGGLSVVVWERGVGLTLACGTGACAAVVASALAGDTAFDSWVPVELPGGLLQVKAAGDLSQVWLRGPATLVFQGTLP